MVKVMATQELNGVRKAPSMLSDTTPFGLACVWRGLRVEEARQTVAIKRTVLLVTAH